jgi:CHASE3 domain sensor protein
VKIEFWDRTSSKLRLGLLAFILIGVLTYQSATSLLDSAQALADRDAISESLQALLSSLAEAEAGRRGYALTGQERQLKQYQTASNRVGLLVEEVRRLTKDSVRQQRRLDTFEYLIAQQLDLLAESIDERRNLGFNLDRQAALTYRSQEVMELIQSQVLTMAQDEERIFAEPRLERKEAAAKRTIYLLVVGNLLALVIAAVAVFRAEVDSRERAAAEMALQNDQAWQELQLQVKAKGLATAGERSAGDHPGQTPVRQVAAPLLDALPRR